MGLLAEISGAVGEVCSCDTPALKPLGDITWGGGDEQMIVFLISA